VASATAWRPPFPCIDVHVHLHPPRLADAIVRHFAHEGWVAQHPFEPAKVAATLAERGVERFCFFSYAHKPGMARDLNRWVAETAAALRQSDTGAYVNFVGNEGEERIRAAYPGHTYDRLAEIKRRYDPDNLFRLNQNIAPAAA